MSKELIKVFVLIGPESDALTTHMKIVDKKKIYYGYAWDIMQSIKNLPQIKKKYNFEFIFSKFGSLNYDSIVDEVSKGKYDMCIGLFIHNTKREKLINFSRDILIEPNAIFYIEKKKTIIDIIKNIYSKVYHLILIFGLFCIIFSLLLSYINKNKKFKNNFYYIIASFFGEYGPLTDKYPVNLKIIILSTIIFLLSFIILAYFEGQILALILEEKIKNIDNFKMRPVIGPKGYAAAKKIEALGVKVIYLDNKNNKELFDFYIKNQNKYSGIALTYCEGFAFLEGSNRKDSTKNLTAKTDFGILPSGFIVNSNKNEFLDDLNISIITLKESKQLTRLCTSYYGKIKEYNVCTLSNS